MRTLAALWSPIVVAAAFAVAQEGEPAAEQRPITFELVEIENLLNVFKASYANPKQPEEDAVSVLENLRKAYGFLDGKGEAATKEELKLKDRIVDTVARGLKVKKRDHVNQECAKTLGEIGAKAGAKPLLDWLEKVVLEARSPNPIFLEYGLQALARIGDESPATLELLVSYGTGRHADPGVVTEVMKAIPNWRKLSPKNRKELFDRLHQYVGAVYADKKNPERFDKIKDTAMDMLTELAGETQKFPDPPAATKWWSENKKKEWSEYVGRPFRKQQAEAKKEEDEKKDGGKP
jgi:hypothetical protein